MVVRCVLVVILTVVVSPATFTSPVFAQGSCEAGVLSQLERDSKRFAEDVNDHARNMVKEELTEAAFSAAKDLTKDNVAAQAVLDTREKWNQWKEHVDNAREALDSLDDCGPNYAFSCLLEQAKKTNQDIMRWLQAQASESVQAVRDRVQKVQALYRNYAERAFGNAQSSIQNYLNNCTTIAEQRIQARGANGAPKSGMSAAGKIATVAVAGASSVAALIYYQKTMEESEALLREFGNISTPPSSPVQNTPSTPAPPTGVRAFDGTYDFEFVRTMPGGAQETVRVPRYLILNNGRLTTAENTINGSVDSGGLVIAVGLCPINSEPADWRGQMLANGTGSGTYTCRFGGISRSWRADNRR